MCLTLLVIFGLCSDYMHMGDLFTNIIWHLCQFCTSGSYVCMSMYVCAAGWCMNRWSLEELVKRDPDNFLILLQQILRKAREVSTHIDTAKYNECYTRIEVIFLSRLCTVYVLCVECTSLCPLVGSAGCDR